MIPTIGHSQKGEIMETVKRSVVARILGSEGRMGGTQGIFRAVKLFCIMLQWWIHVILHLSKPIEYTTPRVNPNVACGLWVIMMCPCRFINLTNTPLCCGMLIVGKAVRVWEQEIREFSVFPTQFCCEPKTSLKIKSI